MLPISFFRHFRDPVPIVSQSLPWSDWVEFFTIQSRIERARKESAPTFSSTIFNPPHRGNRNVTRSGVVVLDIDHHGDLARTAESLCVRRVESLVYTTASSRNPDDRFRILVPLRDLVDDRTYTRMFASIRAVLGITVDGSKTGMSSQFFLPGVYAGADHVCEHIPGEIYDVAEWTARHAYADKCRRIKNDLIQQGVTL